MKRNWRHTVKLISAGGKKTLAAYGKRYWPSDWTYNPWGAGERAALTRCDIMVFPKGAL